MEEMYFSKIEYRCKIDKNPSEDIGWVFLRYGLGFQMGRSEPVCELIVEICLYIERVWGILAADET